VLHPPMYPVNYEFYNELGRHVDLTVIQFGEFPSDHPNWTSSSLQNLAKKFSFKVVGKGSDSLKNQLHIFSFKLFKELKPDIVLSIAFWLPSFISSLCKYLFKFKLIILTNAVPETEKSNSFLRNMYRRLLCANTDCFISATNLTTLYLRSLSDKIEINLSVQTINMNDWREDILSLPAKCEIRDELSLPKDKKILLGVGNFILKKNWELVINSMVNVENCLFVLIGSGEKYNDYLAIVTTNNLENKVKFIERKEGLELKKYFKSADIFILPSLYEQFGFVVSEALASDLPVICSKYTGASTLIKDSYNGYVIDPNKSVTMSINNTLENLVKMKANSSNSIKNLTLANRANEFHHVFKKIS
jgi:glycosyltransferase involved in cell wall biosynthesis